MNLSLESRLRALQAVSLFAAGGRRILAAGSGLGPLAALLREVNETILARSLQFEGGDGAMLALDVAGRRVLRVTAAKDVPGAEALLAVPVLSDNHKDDLCRLLQGFCALSPDLQIAAAPVSRSAEGMTVGLPVSRLAEALGVDLNLDEPEPEAEAAALMDVPGGFFERFTAQMGAGLMAWILRRDAAADPAGDTQAGPEEMVEHLQSFLDDELEAVLAQLDRVARTPGDPVCAVVSADLTQGHSLLCLRAEGAVLVGVISGEAAGSVLQAWNAARR